MTYEEIAEECKKISYRDKLKLATVLLQQGRKEEELLNVEKEKTSIVDFDDIVKRVLKSKPTKTNSLKNFINAMFNFQGSITLKEEDKIIEKLEKKKYLKIEGTKVIYI